MIPVFVTYYGRGRMLAQCLGPLTLNPSFGPIVVIDNTGKPNWTSEDGFVSIVSADNAHKHYAPWKLGLVPKDRPYICTEEDIAISDDCPDDVGDVLLRALDAFPQFPKIGLTIRTDVAPECEERWAVSLGPERAMNLTPPMGAAPLVRPIPVDTHFAIHRAGTVEWPGIVGARLAEPYTCRHLPWDNPVPSEEEMAYYERCGVEWNSWHVGSPARALPL